MAGQSARQMELAKAHLDAVIAHALKLMEARLQYCDTPLTSPQAVKDRASSVEMIGPKDGLRSERRSTVDRASCA